MERLPEVFGRKAGLDAAELTRQKERLERKAGELTMDVELRKKVRTVGHPAERAAMIERGHPHLSVRRQSALLGADRGRVYRRPQGLSEEDLALMRWMDEISLEDPTAGTRRCRESLRLKKQRVSRKRLQRLRRIRGVEAVCPRRRL